MKRATSGGSGGAEERTATSASSSQHHTHIHHQHLQGEEQGDGSEDKFVYRVVGDHSPLWTTLTQAQSITDYES